MLVKINLCIFVELYKNSSNFHKNNRSCIKKFVFNQHYNMSKLACSSWSQDTFWRMKEFNIATFFLTSLPCLQSIQYISIIR